jgi:hypothetical protein
MEVSMKNGTCEVMVVEHPRGIMQGCKTCRQILKRGNFTIGLYGRENGIDYKYLLGAPQEEHCGEEKKFIQCFETAEEAEAEKERVLSHLSTTGSTAGLRLMEFARPGVN